MSPNPFVICPTVFNCLLPQRFKFKYQYMAVVYAMHDGQALIHSLAATEDMNKLYDGQKSNI